MIELTVLESNIWWLILKLIVDLLRPTVLQNCSESLFICPCVTTMIIIFFFWILTISSYLLMIVMVASNFFWNFDPFLPDCIVLVTTFFYWLQQLPFLISTFFFSFFVVYGYVSYFILCIISNFWYVITRHIKP